MKKRFLIILLIVAICLPAFALITKSEEGTTLRIGAKFNFTPLGTGKQITSIELFESAEKNFNNARAIYEGFSYEFDFCDPNGEGFNLNFGMDVFNKKLGRFESGKYSFNFNINGSKLRGFMEARKATILFGYAEGQRKTTSDKDVSLPRSYDYFVGEYGKDMPGSRVGFTYSFDHDPSVTGLFVNLCLRHTNNPAVTPTDKKFIRDLYQRGNSTWTAGATFHIINREFKVADSYVNYELTGNNGADALTYDLGFKYSYDAGPEVNGIYTSLLTMSNKVRGLGSEISGISGINGEVSFHLVDNKVKFQINRITIPGRGDFMFAPSVSSDVAGASIKLANLEYRYSAANKPEDNGLFISFEANQWYEPKDVITVNSTQRLVLHTRYVDGALKTDVAELWAK